MPVPTLYELSFLSLFFLKEGTGSWCARLFSKNKLCSKKQKIVKNKRDGFVVRAPVYNVCVYTYGSYVFTYICVDTYMHAYIRTYIHTDIHVGMHACIHAYMHTCIHAYMHTCIHA